MPRTAHAGPDRLARRTPKQPHLGLALVDRRPSAVRLGRRHRAYGQFAVSGWRRSTSRERCPEATCSSRSKRGAHRRAPLYLEGAFARGASAARWQNARRPGPMCWSTIPPGARGAGRSGAPARARSVHARDHRGHRIGRARPASRKRCSPRSKPRQPGPRAPLGQELRRPCRRAAQPRTDAGGRALRRAGEMGMNHAGRDPTSADRAGPPARRASITADRPAHVSSHVSGGARPSPTPRPRIFQGRGPAGIADRPGRQPALSSRLKAAARHGPRAGRRQLRAQPITPTRACSTRCQPPEAARWSPPPITGEPGGRKRCTTRRPRATLGSTTRWP